MNTLLYKYTGVIAAVVAATLIGCSTNPQEPKEVTAKPELAGGATTIFDATSNAFSTPAPNLSGSSFMLHMEGDAAFEATFVTAPASVNSGLGPVFNNTSCISCHRRDGRGLPAEPGGIGASILFRVSVSGTDMYGGPSPVPGFGGQLQERATHGTLPEGRMETNYVEHEYSFADGTTYTLREPRYTLTQPYIPLPGGVMISPRIAPPVFGLGLLEAIDEASILANVDETDANGDGISGRANYVWDIQGGRMELGRFGWKANTPNLPQQVTAAYNQDMGITSGIFPIESCHQQIQDDGIDDDTEIDDETVRAVIHYVRTLAVPARRNINDPIVKRGEQLFTQANCSGCHIPVMMTGVAPEVPEVSRQAVFPYTDMLLHDMGPGLADGRPDYGADGSEWRTPPLWGIGLTYIVNGHTNFLHDGRARNVMEAIMWHGGEAEASRAYVAKLSLADRRALLTFIESL